ncbi:glycosyl transferase family 1 [Planomonospora sphaerica]|uniref:Glycosyl transferase family 1 n=1 Tax=Planomonospora sphaerica TaxID=161355 RepID=A0A171BKA1_9ACTN|nr:glycosyltransferase [Planomonospora sphaerica]GAT65225.1 glycosyl transferase family 1 [Planomonospora sphaerica]
MTASRRGWPAALAPSVLHVSRPVDGGVAGYVAALAADQVRRGWNVAVACPGSGRLPDELAALGVQWLRWEASRSPGAGVPGEARRLRRLIDGFAPHAVHLHSAKAGLAGRAVLRGRIPTLFQPHGWSWLAARGAAARAALAWERAAARWAGLLVCVGEGEAALAREQGLRGNFTVVRNGVDLDRFRPAGPGGRAAARRLLGLPEHAPLAVCVGRVTRQKGQDLLVGAWERVTRVCPDARLAVVGDGDLRPALGAAAGPGVVFADAVADVRPWYAAADVVVLPSRWEGLPLTALEALASGRPLVAADVPGLSEVVTPRVGALVPPEDAGALAEAVALRLRHPVLAHQEGEAAVARAADFGIRPVLDRLAALTWRVIRDVRADAAGAPAGSVPASRWDEGDGNDMDGGDGGGRLRGGAGAAGDGDDGDGRQGRTGAAGDPVPPPGHPARPIDSRNA